MQQCLAAAVSYSNGLMTRLVLLCFLNENNAIRVLVFNLPAATVLWDSQ